MRIAVEAHALGQDAITGVGNVVLHYLNELQRIDDTNEYFIYTMDGLKHVTLRNEQWRHIDFNYALKRLRIRTRNKWLQLRSEKGGGGAVARLRIPLFRAAKIMLEIADEIVFSFKLASSLKKNRIDIYLGTSTYYYPYFFFSRIKKAGMLYDLVWRLYPDTMEFGNKVRMRLFTLRNMKKLDLLVSISANTKKDAHRILDIRTRIEAVPLAADSDVFFRAPVSSINAARKKYGITKPYILTVCTLEPRKNLKALFEAFSRMKDRDRYVLVLAGTTGWGSDFFSVIEKSGLQKSVIFTGYVPNADLAPLYSGAEAFVFPSLYEGFGLPVLEAMQCGCPVITSDCSSIPEVAGNAAVLIEPEDAGELTDAMERVLKSEALRRKLADRGLERAKIFSWKKSAKTLLGLLESL
jgi:glycosyltransferase involved in cell wall biosynthesis